MISQQSLKKFKALYKIVFGEDLSDAEASRKAAKFLNSYQVVYGSPLEKASAQQEGEADINNNNM